MAVPACELSSCSRDRVDPEPKYLLSSLLQKKVCPALQTSSIEFPVVPQRLQGIGSRPLGPQTPGMFKSRLYNGAYKLHVSSGILYFFILLSYASQITFILYG